MAGYLDHYGAGDERRIQKKKRIALSVVAFLLVAGVLYFLFKNFSQERQAKRFLEEIGAQNYKSAYARWGCTDQQPCRDYPFPEFLKDWGPQAVPPGKFTVRDAEACGSGVMMDVDTGAAGNRKLWVERSNLTLSFPPFPECPQRNRIYDFLKGIKYRMHGWQIQ